MDSFLSNILENIFGNIEICCEQNYQEFGTEVMKTIFFEEVDHILLESCALSV